MARSRTLFQTLLESLFPDDAPEDEKVEYEVYFQEPSNLKLTYPCIIYKFYDVDTEFANNGPYKDTTRYQLTVIDKNPDSKLRDAVKKLPMNVFQRFFVADGLNHYVFNVYF